MKLRNLLIVLVAIATVAGSGNGQSCLPPPPGMLHWWPGHGTSDDILNGADGSVLNGTTFAAGKVGIAFSVDGINDRIDVPVGALPDIPSSGEFSVGLWFNPAAASLTGTRTLFQRERSYLYLQGGELRSYVGGSSTLTGFTVTAGQWTHAVVTYKNGTLRIYVNGSLISTSAALLESQAGFKTGIGYNSRDAIEFFAGRVDEVGFHTARLSDAEVLAVYSAGSLGICPPSPVASVSPGRHALDVPPDADITVTFSTTMNASTFTSASVLVNGEVSGNHAGTLTPVGTTGFTFDPGLDFIPGEIVTVDLTSLIQTSGGQPLTNGHHWSFTAATIPSPGTFGARTDYPVGIDPHSIAISDLDGVKGGDLVVTNTSANTVSILLNNGDGTFGPKADYPTGLKPTGLDIQDIDGDGFADLAVTNRLSNTLSILINSGNGTFGMKTDHAVGSNPRGVMVRDIDGDGDGDPVVANLGPNTISVFINQGGGTFLPRVDYPAGADARHVVIADIDGDGDGDAVTANYGANTVSVLLNHGNGTFGGRVDYGVGSKPFSVFVGDLDGTRGADIAVAHYGSNNVSILKNTGAGTFDQKVSYPAGTQTRPLSLCDVDGDADLDVIATNYGSKTISVFKNDGNGALAPKADYLPNGRAMGLAVADLDGDGRGDLAVVNRSTNTVSILRGNGHLLSVNAVNGSVSKNPDLPGYADGTQVTLTAVADPGYVFLNWSGDASGTTNPVTITMDEDKEVTAIFVVNTASAVRLWGLTSGGGANAVGTLFSFDGDASVITKHVDFSTALGATPNGSLMRASNGKLYGVTVSGGAAGAGVIFEYDTETDTYVKKIDLSPATGSAPRGTLIEASNGKLYGMASTGGANSAGVLFEYDFMTNTYAAKIDLSAAGGSDPTGALFEASNGKLYGTTSEGGSNNFGTIFEYDIASNTYTKKVDMASATGRQPNGSLIEPSTGKLYGTTYGGGANAGGVIFEYDFIAETYTDKLDFTFGIGRSGFGTLLKADNGKLYGLTARGGSSDYGALFEYDLSTNTYVGKANLTIAAGGHPYGSVIQASDGSLYGMTTQGGASGVGTVFRYDIIADAYTTMDNFNGTNGAEPFFGHLLEVAGESSGLPPGSEWAWFPAVAPGNLNSMAYFDSDTGLIVGAGGSISRTVNGGADWSVVAGDSADGTLYAVTTHFDSATAVVCGENGLIKRTTDRGTTWTTIPSGTPEDLLGLTADGGNYSQDVIFAVGDNGVILKSVDDGLSWTMQTSNTSLPLHGVTFFDTLKGIAVGEEVILRTDDGGATWSLSLPALMKGSTSGASMGALASNKNKSRYNVKTITCVVTGAGGSVQRSTNFGATWVAVPSGTTEDLNDLVVVEGTYYAVGNNGTMLASATGENWTPIDTRTTDHIVTVALKEPGAKGDKPKAGTSNGTVGASSSSTSFQIDPPGNAVCSGKSYAISWKGGDKAWNVSLKLYSTATKSTGMTIIQGATPNDGNFLWTVPASTPAGSYQIYIESQVNTKNVTWSYSPTFTVSHCVALNKGVVRGFVTKESSIMAPGTIVKNDPLLPLKQGDPIRGVDVSLGKKPPSVVYHAVTDSSGEFEFTDLEPGDYELQVIPPAGGYIAFPPETLYTFTLQAEDSLEGMEFRLMLTAPDAEWRVVETGTTEDILSVSACDQNTVVAVGGNNTVLYSGDGGASWMPANFPDSSSMHLMTTHGPGAPVKGVKVSCCPCPAPSVAVGGGGGIFLSTDGGANWTISLSGTSVDLNAVEIFDENVVVAVGDSSTILRSTDGGLTWIPATIIGSFMESGQVTLGPGDPLKGIKKSFPSHAHQAIAVGGSGAIYRTTDQGATWSLQPSGTLADLNTVDFFDAMNVIAGGENVILHSSDGGITWVPSDAGQGVVTSLVTVDQNGAYGVGNDGGILFTPDRGMTWDLEGSPGPMANRTAPRGFSTLSLPLTGSLLGVTAASFSDNFARVVLAFGEGGSIIRKLEQVSESFSIQAGEGWNLLSLPMEPSTHATGELFPLATGRAFAYDNGYVAGETLATGRGYWLKFDEASSESIFGTFVEVETVDVNARWNIVGSVSTEIEVISITSDPPGMVTSAFYGFQGGTYSTSDVLTPGRGYWVRVDQPGKLILSSTYLPGNRIKIVPSEELPPPPPGQDESAAAVPTRFALYQNYPNPFNPTSAINFDLPVDSRVSLTVYDLLGSVVATLLDKKPHEAGRHRVEFNAGNLAGSVYFYRLTAQSGGKDFTDVKKMLLMK